MEQTPEQEQAGTQQYSAGPTGAMSPALAVKPSRPYLKKLFFAAAALVLVLGAAAIAYRTLYASPGKVWGKFVAKAVMPQRVHQTFRMSYEDMGETQGTSTLQSMFGNMFLKLKLSADGSVYADYADAENARMALDMNYSLGAADSSFNSKLQMMLLGKVLYLNMGNNPFISSAFAMLSPGEKVEWLKMDMSALQDFIREDASSSPPNLNINYAEQSKAYQDIAAKHMSKAVTVDKFLGKQVLRDVQTMHFSNRLDKQELKSMLRELSEYTLAQMPSGPEQKPEQAEKTRKIVRMVFDTFVDRMEVRSLETWIGISDGQLRKIKFSATAPSVASLVSQAGSYSSFGFSPEKTAETFLKNVSFDGVLNLEEEFYDFDKVQEVKAPEKSLDMVKALREQKQKQDEMFRQYPALPVEPLQPPQDGQKKP